jgi:hypothetical protein
VTGPEDLIAAYRGATLLNVVTDVWQRSDEELAALEDLAVELHERGEIDLLAASSELHEGSGHQFYVVGDFYADVLPRLNADPKAMVETVRYLDVQGGEARDGQFLVPAFRAWCKDERRFDGSIAVLDASDPRDAFFLKLALEGLGAASPDAALERALTILESQMPLARSSAIEALGPISAGDETRTARSIRALRDVVSKHPGETGLAMRVAIEIHARASQQDEDEVLAIIADAESIPAPDLHFHSATALWMQWEAVSSRVLGQMLDMARATRADEPGAVTMLSRAIYQMLKKRFDLAISIAEALLSTRGSGVEIEQLEGFHHLLITDYRGRLDDLAVRWLVSGDLGLGRAVMNMVVDIHGAPHIFQPHLAGAGLDTARLCYLARKAVGFFFHAPVSAASMLLAIMRLADDEATAYATDLLVDPLLLNYSSGLGDHLRDVAANASDPASPHVLEALERHDDYIAGLAAAGRIKALEPSERERFIDVRLRQLEMEKAYKEAEKSSIFGLIATPVHLLHGARVVSYFKDLDGSERRIVNDHQTIGHSTEIPRMGVVDPAGIDRLLRSWRAEAPPQ